MTARARARELIALVDEFAPVGWRRDPAWWALLGTAALVEPRGRRQPPTYLISDAGVDADTFMAAPAPGPRTADDWPTWAVTMAHAAVGAITALDGTLPDQPLAVTVVRDRGRAALSPIGARPRVGFAIGARVITADLDRRGPAHEQELTRRIAGALRGEVIAADAAAPPLVVVAVGDTPPDQLRHTHRRAWTGGGGPWLGVARGADLTAVSTCHFVVDGYGHALLTQAIVGAAVPPSSTVAAPPPPLPAIAAERLDVAWLAIPAPSAIVGAYALGRVLHRRGPAAAERSPPIQLPVAPGRRDDPARRARRVRPALVSVRFPDSRPEPLATFAARARAAIAREADGVGLATRLLIGLTGLPVPVAIKRRAITSRPSRWFGGPAEHLAGDACWSQLRLPTGPPLIAASAPPPHIPRHRGSAVVTVVATAADAIVTAACAGPWPAAELLAEWRAEVETISSDGAAPPASR